jgi:membrane protease subunit (stomatin/prohibitin family)
MFARRRPLLRAAVVGGGAYMAGRSMGRAAEQRDSTEAEQNQRIGDLEQQQTATPAQQQAPAPASAAAEPSMLDQLSQLNTLHEQGVLTDDEFTAAKAKLLGS